MRFQKSTWVTTRTTRTTIRAPSVYTILYPMKPRLNIHRRVHLMCLGSQLAAAVLFALCRLPSLTTTTSHLLLPPSSPPPRSSYIPSLSVRRWLRSSSTGAYRLCSNEGTS